MTNEQLVKALNIASTITLYIAFAIFVWTLSTR